MQIGDLDRRIKIQTFNAIQDTYGEEIKTWSDAITVWANVRYKGGDVKDETERATGSQKIIFTVRNIGDQIHRTDQRRRIEYQDRTFVKYYFINEIREIGGRDGFLELEAENKD